MRAVSARSPCLQTLITKSSAPIANLGICQHRAIASSTLSTLSDWPRPRPPIELNLKITSVGLEILC